MIKSLIVDDEPRAVKALQITLERHCPEIDLIATASNIDDAFRIILSKKPDLVFLDINMPNGTGLDLLERIKDTEECKVIFTTAYEEHAITAFRLSAIDYLLKPIDKVELIQAINRYKKRKIDSERKKISVFTELYKKQHPERIAINTLEGVHVVDIDDLYFLSSEKNYTNFHLEKSIIIASKAIGEYEKWLNLDQFVRIHRSYIINLSKVKEFDKKKNGVMLQNELFIEVSRSKKDLLLQKLKIV
ncbi:LytR/AlgR family response regulator transcription factor [Ekhidna sp.]|uniref:LytR/AlgR family response regulator transcription factor n=1 Tax=Ekhidna sp. TaxID=2608089 RepID=UPI003BA93163